jgi:2-methylaconitate cis-trans-isomerase PrpF
MIVEGIYIHHGGSDMHIRTHIRIHVQDPIHPDIADAGALAIAAVAIPAITLAAAATDATAVAQLIQIGHLELP